MRIRIPFHFYFRLEVAKVFFLSFFFSIFQRAIKKDSATKDKDRSV